jgi:hypothetical protein
MPLRRGIFVVDDVATLARLRAWAVARPRGPAELNARLSREARPSIKKSNGWRLEILQLEILQGGLRSRHDTRDVRIFTGSDGRALRAFYLSLLALLGLVLLLFLASFFFQAFVQ